VELVELPLQALNKKSIMNTQASQSELFLTKTPTCFLK